VGTILIILNWSNWLISCSLNVCLCFVWRLGVGPLPHPLLGYATGNRLLLFTAQFGRFIIISLFTQKVAIQQYNAHKKRQKKQTCDTKKQCPGRINQQNKTHEGSTLKHTIIIAIQNQTYWPLVSLMPIRRLTVAHVFRSLFFFDWPEMLAAFLELSQSHVLLIYRPLKKCSSAAHRCDRATITSDHFQFIKRTKMIWQKPESLTRRLYSPGGS